MSRTFLQLCQDVVADLGVAGGTLSSVTSSSLNQEQLRIIGWVARADLTIQNLWADWSFLWYRDPAVIAQAGASQLAVTLPSWAASLQTIDRCSMWQDYGLSTSRVVPWMDWERFASLYYSRPLTTAPNPSCFSQDPGGNLYLSNNVPVQSTFSLAYWCLGNRMANNTDISRIPVNFDQIICERAKIYYAQRENAPEIMSGATAEFIDGLEKLQAWGLPNNTAGRRSRNDQTTAQDGYVE